MRFGSSARARLARVGAVVLLAAAAQPMDAQGSGRAPSVREPAEPHPYQPGIDVLDYELSLDLPAQGNIIEGRAVLSVRRTAPRDSLVLDLLDLRVDSVLVNGAPAAFRRDERTIRIPIAPAAGDSFAVAVRYGGAVTDGLIVRTDSLGRWTGFGDNWPDRARHWIPSVDHPSDKATVTWIVRAPSGRRVVANGRLEEETPLPVAGGGEARTLTRWRESRPIPVYLMVIGAAPLAYYDLGDAACGLAELGGCVRQSAYVAPEVRGFLPGPFARVDDIVELFARLVAPFPYEKLAHLQSATRFGGMENASAIFYADEPFRTRTMRDGVVAHETAHQWFGDAVTERQWGHLWLSEGFATYFEQLWQRHSHGDSTFRAGMARLRREIIASEVTASRPVLDTAETDYLKLLNSNSYQKGGWTLHMLRALVGDSAFFRGVREYYLAHRHGTALTSDLRAAVERASGQQLGWFFDQWLTRPGYADVTARWRYDARSRRVVLDIAQGTRWPPYRFPLVVELTGADGKPRRATVQVAARRTQRVTVPLALPGPPEKVVLDPDVEVLGEIREAEY